MVLHILKHYYYLIGQLKDKDLGDNYYFNLMINEDMNKTSVGLKKSSQRSSSSFKRK